MLADFLVVLEELLDVVLGDDVEADRGLVEEQHFGRVEQGGDELHLHPLAERELADRLVEQLRDAQQVDELVLLALKRVGLDAVDLLVQAERFGSGQVPPELVLLAHHEGEAAAVGVVALPGHVAEDAGLAGGGIDDAGEQLERRGFAGAVGAEEGDKFAGVDIEIDAADGLDFAILAVKEALEWPPTGPLSFGRRGTTSPGRGFR